MKKISIFFAVLCAAVFATGCAKDAANAPGRTVLKASLSSITKTAIEGVKVSWTAGDAIKVNGANSYPLEEGGATATFEFRAALTAPYSAVYPTSIYKDESTVTLPLLINMDTFSLPLSGYLAEGDEITFKAMTALIKLSITGESTTTIKDITLKGLGGEQLSGDFTINYETGALTGASEAEANRAVKINVGKALSSTALVVYIPIPAGEYSSGYQIEILDTEGGLMRNNVSARTLTAGQLRQMPEIAFEPNVSDDPSIGGIPSAQELRAFAAAVNDGRSIARWLNASGEVELLNDIDCADITDWTPIGSCTMPTWAHNNIVTSGNLFTGTFDGKNHSIKNLHLNFTPTEANGAYGLFGGIGKGGVVKNIVFDASCSLHIETGKAGVFGMLAGLVLDGDVDNVKNYAPITGGGTSALANNAAGGRVAVGGLIGWVHATDNDVTISNLYNAGAIGTSSADFTRGGNGGNGANGFLLGGVVGFSSNNNNEKKQTLSQLMNDGDIYTNTGRASGIVSSANRYTVIKGAVNNGNILHSASGTFRLGLITCIAAAGVELEDCINYGELIAPGVASAAGICCLINDDSVKITRCKSIGATIVCTGFNTDGNSVTYAGALYGQCNKLATFSGCSVSGKVGKTEETLLTLTAENYFPFVGQANANNTTINSTNITFFTE
ncbi:MAG: hypothetical protein IK045_06890 [Bacteroidales bacterium]|nr:hypothetical protein [Bacteroidales bacterium]